MRNTYEARQVQQWAKDLGCTASLVKGDFHQNKLASLTLKEPYEQDSCSYYGCDMCKKLTCKANHIKVPVLYVQCIKSTE